MTKSQAAQLKKVVASGTPMAWCGDTNTYYGILEVTEKDDQHTIIVTDGESGDGINFRSIHVDAQLVPLNDIVKLNFEVDLGE